MTKLQASFIFPCRVEIQNRIVKAAMSENMADKGGRPSQKIFNLYEQWGKSGAGLLISGNVMVDSRALGEPYNVVVENEQYLPELQKWAALAQQHGSQLWMQINHPGRQAPLFNQTSVSASDVELNIPGIIKRPRPLTEEEIYQIIDRFGNTAAIAQKAGWKGVEIHGAHGYLVSQFLSSHTNKRTDLWGGSLENRARFAIEIYRNMRKKVGPDFPIGIKINSADFQKGGFSEEESLEVIDMISAEGIDLIEVSGGTYEQAAMMGVAQKESTRQREAYFLDFIVKARKRTKTPLLLTGGFRSKKVMEKALQNDELDFVGLARPFVVNPSLASDILGGKLETITLEHSDIFWYGAQLQHLAEGV